MQASVSEVEHGCTRAATQGPHPWPRVWFGCAARAAARSARRLRAPQRDLNYSTGSQLLASHTSATVRISEGKAAPARTRCRAPPARAGGLAVAALLDTLAAAELHAGVTGGRASRSAALSSRLHFWRLGREGSRPAGSRKRCPLTRSSCAARARRIHRDAGRTRRARGGGQYGVRSSAASDGRRWRGAWQVFAQGRAHDPEGQTKRTIASDLVLNGRVGYISPIEFEKAPKAQVGVHETGSSPLVRLVHSSVFSRDGAASKKKRGEPAFNSVNASLVIDQRSCLLEPC